MGYLLCKMRLKYIIFLTAEIVILPGDVHNNCVLKFMIV